MIGFFVWFAIQSLVANYSVYYSYGLWMLTLFCTLILVAMNSHAISKNKKVGGIYLLSFGTAYAVSTIFNGCLPNKTYFIELLFGYLFLILRRETQYKIVQGFIWAFSFLMLLGLIEYFFYYFFNVSNVIATPTRELSHSSTPYSHLYFNLIERISIFPRYQCIANEPGLIGTLSGFLLFIVGRDKRMRIPLVIILLSGIFSFSLAFYFLALLFLISGVVNLKKIIIVIISVFVLFSLAYSMFQDLILQRVMVDNLELIDNRSTAGFDFRFAQAWNEGKLWLGVGFNNLPTDVTMGATEGHEGGNAGAKKWIFEYGIISLIVLFVGFLRTYYRLRGGKLYIFDIAFLVAFWLSFYQRQTVDTCYTLLAFCGVPVFEFFKEKEKMFKIETT